ncbi:MAG: type VI secretion system membrane subunit TssM [Gammaproteobacteria bacterium]
MNSQAILLILQLPWLRSLVGVGALITLLYQIGPIISFSGYRPLSTDPSRTYILGGIVALWALYQLVKHLLGKRKTKRMATDLAKGSPDPVAAQTAEEFSILQKTFQEALEDLKKAKLDSAQGQQLYQLPWYMIIGPPGAGKTTALVNSGLNFPLAKKLGKNKVRGVGGTRNCDWWFTDQAVLLDTAGRYTTQDSQQEVDKAGWTNFLGLLKKYRKRRPINGVIVAISLADLMQETESERAAHAITIRKRIQELYEQLKIRFPVYVLFTKADLIAGFLEFFDDLSREERGQVWGMTFPLDDLAKDSEPAVENFGKEFDLLEQRLNTRLLKRLQDERDPQRRDLIYIFPQQFNTLKGIAIQFLDEVFQPNRFEERSFLRGVYFTSGTQEGNPIDRMLGALATTFGLARQTLPSFSGEGRSYFLTRLFKNVMFPEAGLASTNPRLERRMAWLRRASYAGVLALTVLGAGAWYNSYARNQSFVQDIDARLASLNANITALSSNKDRTPIATLAMLNEARALPGATGAVGLPWLYRLGLYQGDKIGSSAQNAYRRLLDKGLLPRLILRLEQQLRGNGGKNEDLYNTLAVYLMLDRNDPERPFEVETIRNWFARDWDSDPTLKPEQRQQLKDHLNALLEQLPVPLPLALDETLIDQSRKRLTELPSAERLYNQLLQARSDVPDFRLSDAVGRDVATVFIRPSGKLFSTGVKGLFTKRGFEAFTAQSQSRIQALASQGWVYGKYTVGADQLEQINSEIQRRYRADFCPQWKELVNDIDVIRPENLQKAVTTLNILSGPESPIRNLLKAIAAEIADLPPTKDCLVELNRLVQGDKPPLDGVLTQLNEIAVVLAPLAKAEERAEAIDKNVGNDAVTRLETLAGQQPPPTNRWFRTLADEISRRMLGGIRAFLDGLWRSSVLPVCEQALNNRYPFDHGSNGDTPLQDFGRFFGAGGLIENFFNSDFKTFVDMTQAVWSWRKFDGNTGIQKKTGPTATCHQNQSSLFLPRRTNAQRPLSIAPAVARLQRQSFCPRPRRPGHRL